MNIKTKSKQPITRRNKDYMRCFICGQQYGHQNLTSHRHSYVHHEAIENLKGSEQLHTCLACNVSVMGLEKYKEHISTRKHTYKLFRLNNRMKKKKIKKTYSIHLNDDHFRDLKIQQKEKKKLYGTCFVCCERFPIQDMDNHMHTISHHQVIEDLKGSPQLHKCWACDLSMGMAQFMKHVKTHYHQFMLFALQMNTADGKSVDYTAEIDDELRLLCGQRDQMKRREKKWKRAQKKNNKKSVYWSMQVMDDKFTDDELPSVCYFFTSWNHHPASLQVKQTQPEPRQESMPDMDSSDGPLGKISYLEKPSENHSQEVSAPTEHPSHIGKVVDVCINEAASETEEPSRMEPDKNNLTTARQDFTIQKETTGNEAVVPQHPPQKHTHARRCKRRKDMDEQEPYVDSLPSVSSLPETVESQTSKNDSRVLETAENAQPHAVRVKKKKSNKLEMEQRETSLENPKSFETNCNVRKTKKRKQVVSRNNRNPERNCKISRKGKVNKLMMLSLKEDELTSSLEDVGDQLMHAYSTLQSSYTEVQRLLAVKQQVTSEMASLREKRINILQDMKNTTECSSHSDQQVVLNIS